MQRFLLAVDKISTFFGQVFSWLIVGLTILITWEVYSRYVLNKPHAWALDAQIMLYGTLFMMAGAYTLAKNNHVRGDVLYGFFRPRTQAWVDLILYIAFFLPGVISLTYAGWGYFHDSFAIREQTFSAEQLPIYPFKFVIPVAGALLLLQGIVEIIRCVLCIRDGEWPSRIEDVEEVDVDKLKQMVHVKDEDILAADAALVAHEREPKMKIRKELWFGFTLMAILVAGALYMLLSAETITRGHLGLLMLSLVVVAIMMGFPTAFTLMGMGILFTWLSYDKDIEKTLDLFVQSTFKVMSNDVLISIPLFVFMGYLVERANLIEKLFKSLHLAMARIPGSLAVATLVTCAVFATATGIVGAVVTLMGLLAFPAMLKAGYNTKLGAGVITAGGCLGILIPPSVMLIVYGATAGVSVVQLYAGAFLPGIMLAGLYVGYVILVAKVWPHMAPPLSEEDRKVKLPPVLEALSADGSKRALPAVLGACRGRRNANVRTGDLAKQAVITLTPLLFFAFVMAEAYVAVTTPPEAVSTLQQMDSSTGMGESREAGGLAEPEGVQEPPSSGGVTEPPGADVKEPPGAAGAAPTAAPGAPTAAAEAPKAQPASIGFWIALGVGTLALAIFYAIFSVKRLEIFRMLLASFFPLVMLILAVLGSIVFGLTTPTEAAAIGSFGGFVLAAVYMLINYPSARMRKILLVWVPLWVPFLASIVWFRLALAGVVPNVPTWFGLIAIIGIATWSILALRQAKLMDTLRESSFLTAKTSAMVCWLFVGSAIFSAAFALLGGQQLVEQWVLSMNLTKTEFLLLSQVIIFILGWPLEWTEIIVIFMPIFVPLLDKFGVDPLFFGLLVALNLQTAFLSPPVAMAAFYLKGVSPPHVTLNQIFAGMMPFMAIQVVAIFLLYMFPAIGLWIPSMVYGK